MSHKKNKEKSHEPKPSTAERRVQFPENEEKIVINEVNDDGYNYFDGSGHSLYEDDHHDELISNREVNVSALKKYINTPLREVTPRPLTIIPCNQQSVEQEILSTRQLLDILRNSPTPSGVHLNLINATYMRKLRAVKYEIRNGADVNTKLDRQTPLMIATEFGDARLVAYLLTIPEVNPNTQNRFGHTPLIVAVRNGFEQIVRLLLKHNADVNLPDYMGKTPLHCALFAQRMSLVKLLLAFGANYEKSDCFGEKPMYTATVKKPNLECLKSLLRIGAMPDYNTVSGIPLLSRTILNGTDFNIIKTLIKYGASVNSQDLVSRKTPLHFAAIMDNLNVTELLISEGADINLRTTYNFTPLDEANFHRSLEVKIYLLDLQLRAAEEEEEEEEEEEDEDYEFTS